MSRLKEVSNMKHMSKKKMAWRIPKREARMGTLRSGDKTGKKNALQTFIPKTMPSKKIGKQKEESSLACRRWFFVKKCQPKDTNGKTYERSKAIAFSTVYEEKKKKKPRRTQDKDVYKIHKTLSLGFQ